MVTRVLASLSATLIVAGCAGSPLAAPRPGTISGHVSTRACGGAAREDSTGCAFRPAPGLTLAFRRAGGGDASYATTDATGFYSIQLPAGQYRVEPKNPMPPAKQAGPRLVEVPAGATVTADFSYTIQLL
ncbi:MAG: carboxypeptidase-like regulatory domain-containing protein [Candidatus Dormibacteraeota bacterium]|nr:carboxypeptidase-like regulatory domain-containing protein [Candidatus Dormibacteraeota bacterium]